ncbi:MAG TPA: GerMN domain-containing protein [Acidimicrobiia bacterium]|nr:GerMN domain-containing protein [Acidimicrobiia bacterium]
MQQHRSMARTASMVALVGLMIAALLPAAAQELAPGGTFIDDDGNVHEGYIEAIAAEGITRGCNPPTNDRYCPSDPVSRGEMAAFLTRALGLTASSTDQFTDDDDSVFENDINALAAAGITRGCNPPANDRFCPDGNVTRGQMAAFLVRAMGYTDAGDGDLFTDDDDSVFENDIDRLGTAGVTRGCNPPANDRFCPTDLVLRDQMASFLGRAMNLEARTPPPTMAVAPYFFIDEDGHTGRSGPFLAPIHRTVAESVAVATASMQALLEGPTSDEQTSIPALSTAIPDGTTLNSVSIEDGVATVDLSAEFEAEEASAAASARTAQVVFTLTRFSTVDSVSFLEDGVPVSVRTDNGNVADEPVDRGDYLDYQAAISVESPTYGGFATDPLRVTGQAAVFEATFQYALTDADGLIIEEGVAMSGSGVGWAGFDFTIDYSVDRSQRGALIVWTDSAQDGSRIDIREYPIFLER